MSGQEKIYQMITDQITSKLKEGTIPWQKPWQGGPANSPCNFQSKRPYRGINPFILMSAGYASRYWLTYKQAQKLGGQVRKGEKSLPVIFWKWIDKEVEDRKTGEKKQKHFPMLRYYNVFNLDQIEGIENPDTDDYTPAQWQVIESAEKIVAGMPAPPYIQHQEIRAYYRPSEDTVNVPPTDRFPQAEEYYSTLFHELVHSTGHESRLDRMNKSSSGFRLGEYSKEELCAEMGSAFLAGEAGISESVIDNSAAYIESWLKALQNNPKWVVQAAAQAQKAADYILDRYQGNQDNQDSQE